jgi:hypothetical protein
MDKELDRGKINLECIRGKELVREIWDSSCSCSPDTVKAYECGRGYIIVSDVCEVTRAYYTEDKELTEREMLIEWALDESLDDIFNQVIRCNYGTSDPEDYAVPPGSEVVGPFVICGVRFFNGYTPHSLVNEDSYTSGYKEFSKLDAALEWIKRAEDKTYILDHNEYAAPEYYIWDV